MRSRAATLLLATLLAACSTLPREPSVPLHGRLELSVEPNPIIATRVGDNLYELQFDIIMREAGGVGVRIEDFTVEAMALNSVPVRKQTFPATFITSRGYPASIAAGKYLRFSFTKRWTLPTPLVMSGGSARITARTVDENGVRSESRVRVDVKSGDR